MHAHEDRLVVTVCVGSHGRESLGMNSSMQAMAGCCGAWGWTCALCATVCVVACISLLCNSINSNTIPENAAPLAAPNSRVHRLFPRCCSHSLAAVRFLTSGIRAKCSRDRAVAMASPPRPRGRSPVGKGDGKKKTDDSGISGAKTPERTPSPARSPPR